MDYKLDKLWIYTNYDCNLHCRYCVAESHPRALRRALGHEIACKLVDEALQLGFREVFLTGGEPFLLDEIYPILAYAVPRVKTTVLTNATLLHGRRLERLMDIIEATRTPHNFVIQVSLDGARPEHHDPYRGKGSWEKTIQGIQSILQCGFQVHISTTVTPANREYLSELRLFCQDLGIPEEAYLIRPLARRGFSTGGIKVGMDCLAPELTVTQKGVYWHPLAPPDATDMLISHQIFPLDDAALSIQKKLDTLEDGSGLREFT